MSLVLSGLRNSEFCRLTLGDFRREDDGWCFVVRARGDLRRTVYIARTVGGLMSEYVEGLRPRLLRPGVDSRDCGQPLVINERGRPFDRTGLYRRVVRILTEAGFGERASVQLLRHTYGYLAYLRTGGNLLFVQRQLGHAHPRITSVYAQLVEESYPELAERVATAIDCRPDVPSRKGIAKPHRPRFDCEID